MGMTRSAGAGGAPARDGAALGALEPAVAVMPFTNLGGDPAQEYFSDGLADELIASSLPQSCRR
jgi:TolB-like protein